MQNGDFVDYYDLLMISPIVDVPMLEAAVRVMASRYNPNNSKTGDKEKFEAVKQAYLTLSDPHNRAAYDKKRARHYKNQTSPRELEELVASEDVQLERQKRRGILLVLYKRVMTHSHDPSVSVPHIAGALGVVAEELQFAFWFLRERGWISREGNGNFAVTVDGVAWIEDEVIPHPSEESTPWDSHHSGAPGQTSDPSESAVPGKEKEGVAVSAA